LYHSTLGSRVIKKKKKGLDPVEDSAVHLQLPGSGFRV